MTPPGTASDPRDSVGAEKKLPLRDWFFLPLLALLTVVTLTAALDEIAGRIYPESGNVGHDCIVEDPRTGVHGIPNCVSSEKHPETPLIEYRFNNCGHVAGMPCEGKVPGVFRIVMIGSSTAMGFGVARERSFAALLPEELSRRTGRRIELYNESLVRSFPRTIALNFREVREASPDLILWILTAADIRGELPPPHSQLTEGDTESGRTSGSRLLRRVQRAITSGSARDEVLSVWDQHSISLLARHLLYQSPSLYVKSYLMQGDEAGFLRTPPNVEWQNRLRLLDGYTADIEAQAKTAGVPLAAVFLPTRGQAAMLSSGEWPKGYDPFLLDDTVRSIVTARGAVYIDVVPDFRGIANAERIYFPVDGHLNPAGHKVVSSLLAAKLSGAINNIQGLSDR
jgi:hypothetical protein